MKEDNRLREGENLVRILSESCPIFINATGGDDSRNLERTSDMRVYQRSLGGGGAHCYTVLVPATHS